MQGRESSIQMGGAALEQYWTAALRSTAKHAMLDQDTTSSPLFEAEKS
jgi:hypothetical protein